MSKAHFVLQTDGAARGNPGPAAAGIILEFGGEVVLEHGQVYADCTNNVSEYRALILGLEKALPLLEGRPLRIQMDSELVVKQINGQYKVKKEDLKPLWAEAKTLLGKVNLLGVEHIRRKENARADKLANLALDGKL